MNDFYLTNFRLASSEEFSETTDYDVATINAFLGCQSQELIRLSLLGGNANKGANAFQFHMVRLKVSPANLKEAHDKISIPYGAIKSHQWQ